MPFGRLVLATLTLILAFAPLRSAATAWDQPFAAGAQDLLLATEGLPSESGDGVVVLLQDQRWSLDEEARCEITQRLVYRIVDDDGVRGWGSVEATWEPWRQGRPTLRARVIRPDGTVRELDPGTIDEAAAHDDLPDVLTSTRVLRAPLPNLAPGCVVEREIVTRDEAPLMKGLFSRACWLGMHLPIASSRFTVDAPMSLALRVLPRGVPVAPERVEHDGRVSTTWAWQAVPRDDAPLRLSPLGVPPWPQVAVTTAVSWGEVAAAYSAIIDERARIEDVAARAKAVAGDAPDAREAAARCLADMHAHVRYTGLEFGQAAVIPAAPATCLERGYGDCKDKATLLVAMLRSLGHRADVALLMPGRPFEIDEEMPGLADFTHAIAAVGDPPVFIDATAPEAAVGELPDMDRGHLVLVARRGVEGLVRLPETTPDADRVVEVVDVVLAEEGRASLTETRQCWGSFAVSDRANRVGITPEELARSLTPYAERAYGAAKVAGAEASAASNLASPTTLHFRVEEPTRTFTEWPAAGVAISYGGWVSTLYGVLGNGEEEASVSPTPAATRRRVAEESRTLPLVLPRAFAWDRTYRVVPPPGHELVAPPEIQPFTFGPATFSAETTARDGGVDVAMHFSTGDGRFTREQAKALGDRLMTMYEATRPLVVYRSVGSRLLGADDTRGGLAELRRLAALHPKEALHHVHLATSLLEVGLGEAARREAALAVKLEPASALAWRVQGYVLQHDVLGRPHGAEADDAGAIAALREAKRLDPADARARRMLAEALGRDRGFVSWDPAKARAEAEELRALEKDLAAEAEDVDDSLVAALHRAGDHDAVLAMSDAASGGRSETFDATVLASLAARDGVPAALARVDMPPFHQRDRSSLLESVAGTLADGRHYPEAAAMFAEAARSSDHAARLGAKADATRRLRRHDGSTLPEDDPRSVVQRLLLGLVRGDAKSVEPLVDASRTPEDRAAFFADFHALFARGDISADVALDKLTSSLDLLADTDGADGARVRLRWSGAEPEDGPGFFVRRRSSGWQLVGTDDELPVLGKVALEHAVAGHVEQARRWLDWAREEWGGDRAGRPAFGASWTQGQAADAAQCRLAAAMLLASGDESSDARRELAAAREPASPEVRKRIDEAIALACENAGDHEAALAAARPLAEAETEAGTGTRVLVRALTGLGRAGEAAELLRHRLADGRESTILARMLALALARAGKVEEAVATVRAMDARGASAANDHNNAAWWGLILGSPPATLLEDAQAAAAGDAPTPSALHTLASVLVELGRLREARQTMFRKLEVDDDPAPTPTDWYVFGRLAEEYGETDAAREALARVLKADDEGDPTAARVLAQRRLDRLAAAATPAVVASPPG